MIVNDCRDGDSLDGVSGNPWNELFVIIVMEIVRGRGVASSLVNCGLVLGRLTSMVGSAAPSFFIRATPSVHTNARNEPGFSS